MDSEGKHTGVLKGVKMKGVKSPSKLNPMWTLTSGSSFKDTTQKGDQVWLNEDDVPLYLLKDFEEQLRKLYPSKLSKSARGRKGKRQNLRLSKTDRLSMLLQKHIQLDDNNDSSSWKCASCKSVIFARQLVQCQKCCVTFHKECVEASSQVDSFTCSRCLIPRKNKRGRKPKSISLSQNTNLYSSKVSQANRKGKVEDLKPISEMPKDQGSTNLNSVGLVHVQRKKRTSNLYVHKNGILWRKVKPEADLLTFRRDKIVLVGQHGTDHLRGPICCLCSQPYNPAFMYIGCEFCKEWFHADGFGVSEEKLLLLAGFKCYKCRKKGPPECPYVGRKDSDHSYLFSQVSSDHVKAMTGDDRQLVGNIDLDPCVIANITIPVSEEVDELAVAPSIDFLVQEGFTTGWKPDTEVPLTTIDLVKTHNIVPVPDFDWASLQNEFFSPDADASECNNVQVCEQSGMQTNSYDTSEHERAQPNFQAGGPANYLPQLPCRGPLSFLELLSSEDDMVENVPFTEMDFNLNWPSDVSINEHISSAVLNDNGNLQPGILMSQDAESMDIFDRSLKSGHATEEGGLFGLICESTTANCEIG
ncbi:hypothetical protein O6H91_08G099600 [Diphasiastrum complanatum]|uniref:Uncharacterized protein n=1 Tax=Diphasiastrum complanatum TaxID=34168 RepID=A0ACC2D0K4_DIPCM|nr:hypothetical protein O6H91_08G099600 [Diphasiastrum complanatum]